MGVYIVSTPSKMRGGEKSMTKSELIDAVSAANDDITRREAEVVVSTVFSAIF